MSTTLSVKGYKTKESPEFKKHYKAVEFCIENELTFPKETSEFFKGKIGGEDLENIRPGAILENLKHGVECVLPCKQYSDEIHIRVSDIPSYVDLIIVETL
ncbi:MAG: hypothetical protein IPM04_02150 [Saprospiraceae bacterium]|jgi:hypothetical protein|nr:hypothetical protein [Candidatus Brachybacter algidus]MBK8746682.1 hypothetical protein [Candidatus Brachybacter algidus]